MKNNAIKEWVLEGQTYKSYVTVAARAALRTFPILTHVGEFDDARMCRMFLFSARNILAAATAVKFSSLASTALATADHASRFAEGDFFVANPKFQAYEASKLVAFSARPTRSTPEANQAIQIDVRKAIDNAQNALSTCFSDEIFGAATVHDTKIPGDLFLQYLWHVKGEPEELRSALELHLPQIFEIGPEWFFWREWYQGFLDGKPMDWELQRRVALIDDAIWEAGPEAVAKEIEKIRARYDVEAALQSLAAEKDAVLQTRLGIGGNNPPEAIDEAPVIEHHITLIWAGVNDLTKEVEAETPDKRKVEAALAMIGSGLAACLKWCAKKGDLVVDTLIKWGIPAAGGGYLALNPDKVSALIEAVKAWLPYL